MTDAPASIPERWTMCHEARRFRAAVFGRTNASAEPEQNKLDVTRIVEREDGRAVQGEWCVTHHLSAIFLKSHTFSYMRLLFNTIVYWVN
jgi:acid phosphatase